MAFSSLAASGSATRTPSGKTVDTWRAAAAAAHLPALNGPRKKQRKQRERWRQRLATARPKTPWPSPLDATCASNKGVYQHGDQPGKTYPLPVYMADTALLADAASGLRPPGQSVQCVRHLLGARRYARPNRLCRERNGTEWGKKRKALTSVCRLGSTLGASSPNAVGREIKGIGGRPAPPRRRCRDKRPVINPN